MGLRRSITVDAAAILEVKQTVHTMVDQLTGLRRSRVSRGRWQPTGSWWPGDVRGAAGTWKD